MNNSDIILLDHGSGGELSYNLMREIIMPRFGNEYLLQGDDGAVFDIEGKKIAFSTDSYTVDPIFFPGGDIGELAINGTVNDISMCGAMPLYIGVGIIMEEGFAISDLDKIAKSMSNAAKEANVKIVTGDTKVVPKGALDKIFINTSGIGLVYENRNISGNNAKPGDKIILSGNIADHGITILTQRKLMHFDSSLKSDTAPLNHMVRKILSASEQVHTLRDPTRGGVSAALNEIAKQSDVGILIYEDKIPFDKEVSGICELLGIDPLYIANEGKLLAFVTEDDTDKVLLAVKEDKYGKNAAVIGEATTENSGKVVMQTRIGGARIVNMPIGEQLPRIC